MHTFNSHAVNMTLIQAFFFFFCILASLETCARALSDPEKRGNSDLDKNRKWRENIHLLFAQHNVHKADEWKKTGSLLLLSTYGNIHADIMCFLDTNEVNHYTIEISETSLADEHIWRRTLPSEICIHELTDDEPTFPIQRARIIILSERQASV